MNLHHKTRWVLSPLVFSEELQAEVPAVRDYATTWDAPYHHDGHALVRCTFNAQQMEAVLKDARFVVCDSLHARTRIHTRVAEHHAEHGLHDKMLLHEALEELGKLNHAFLPDF